MKVRESNKKSIVDYAELNPGDCFKYEGVLYMKINWNQDATCLRDGHVKRNMCGEQVTPVNAEVQIID